MRIERKRISPLEGRRKPDRARGQGKVPPRAKRKEDHRRETERQTQRRKGMLREGGALPLHPAGAFGPSTPTRGSRPWTRGFIPK